MIQSLKNINVSNSFYLLSTLENVRNIKNKQYVSVTYILQNMDAIYKCITLQLLGIWAKIIKCNNHFL